MQKTSEYKYYIRHNAKKGMVVHLSDQDSERIINLKTNQIGDEILIYSKNNFYKAEILDIGISSVSVKILEVIEKEIDDIESRKTGKSLYDTQISSAESSNPVVEKKSAKKTSLENQNRLMLLYSIIPEREYRYALEKAIEIGTDYIVPIVSGYSYIKYFDAIKARNRWQEIVSEAVDQSRTNSAAILTGIVKIEDLDKDLDKYSIRYKLGNLGSDTIADIDNDKKIGTKATTKKEEKLISDYNPERMQVRVALATENLNKMDFYHFVQSIKEANEKNIDYIVAIGPEKGWDSNDIKVLKENNFVFAQLGDNILRAESVGLAVGTIVKLTSDRK